MSIFNTYTTIDDKIISTPDISYIDAITTAENGLKKYDIVHHNGNAITVMHADEQLLKKDRRKLEKIWDNPALHRILFALRMSLTTELNEVAILRFKYKNHIRETRSYKQRIAKEDCNIASGSKPLFQTTKPFRHTLKPS